MRILICHERLLFRFGADRVLLLLARGLRDMGHQVILAASRYDAEVAVSFADRVIQVPGDLGPYLDLNELTDRWLREHWHTLFSTGTGPDVVIVGGWPFIAAIPFFRQVCGHVVFIDFGVVPAEGYSEGMTITLEKLRRLRREFLSQSSVVVGISDFIVNSQSRQDAGPGTSVKTILLGADHVDMSVWPASQIDGTSSGKALSQVRAGKANGTKIVLCLGRWEPGCYKNSQVAFDVLERLITAGVPCCLLLLERKEAVAIPANLEEFVIPMGFPDDTELNEIMRESDLGISMSLWEGFNLPLAEMQWLGRPALVFNAGAHREVAAHPWYVCDNVNEMAQKAAALLRGEGLDQGTATEALHRFRNTFTWGRFADEYGRLVHSFEGKFNIIVDVTNSTRDPANSGVIRVTRRLSRELQRLANPLFAVWDARSNGYVLPTKPEYDQLSQFNGPQFLAQTAVSKSSSERVSIEDALPNHSGVGSWILLPETMMESEFRYVRDYGRSRGFKIAAIFYDAIPVLRPDLCNAAMRDNHAAYMKGLAECDLAIPISGFSADCLLAFWRENQLPSICKVAANLLPGEFGGAVRNRGTDGGRSGQEVRILCVSTLEPRKNHKKLIEACLQMGAQHPELNWCLTLIGNRYAGAFEIAEYVESVVAKNPRVRWLGIVDDTTLLKHYRDSWFTVYASNIEGFGLPIMESLWHGRPCICHREGVMAELAAEGGCLTTDVTDHAVLAQSIYRLATDVGLHQRLTREATTRPIKTWTEYGRGVIDLVKRAGEAAAADPLLTSTLANDYRQMALAGLLAIRKPHCSIRIGSSQSGDLRLVSAFSEMVFSVDINPESTDQPAYSGNISYLSGNPSDLLPILFNELEAAGIPINFLLIDGHQPTAEFRRQLGSVLGRMPRAQMLAVLSGSFEPDLRKEMEVAPWESSPYCHSVNLDFIPGIVAEDGPEPKRRVEGGYALACFEPAPRIGSLSVRHSENDSE